MAASAMALEKGSAVAGQAETAGSEKALARDSVPVAD